MPTWAVAYLGFQKGGAKFSLATSAHTKGGGAKPSFPIFLVCKKNFFFAKGGGHGPMAPPKYATEHGVEGVGFGQFIAK